MSGYTAAWLAITLAFGIVELRALLNSTPGDTYSESLWRWFAVKAPHRTPGVVLRRLLLLAWLGWSVVHFVSGGRFP